MTKNQIDITTNYYKRKILKFTYNMWNDIIY